MLSETGMATRKTGAKLPKGITPTIFQILMTYVPESLLEKTMKYREVDDSSEWRYGTSKV